MKILADKNIPCIYKLFKLHNDLQICEGRFISANHLKDVDVLIIRSVTTVNRALLVGSCVKFIGTVTSGIDHIDQSFLKEHGISFFSAPGSNAIAVVEYIFSALLWLAKRDGFFLRDKIVGIVGVGHIGSLLHQRLHAFGIHVLLCDPILAKIYMHDDWKSLEELVKEVDILTLHTPLIKNGDYPTWHMINIDVLDALPDGAIVINTCRGAVIDNQDLLKIFQNGKKLNVVLDVWEWEPELSLPLLSYVDIGTPHIAGYTVESKVRGILQIYNEYCKFFHISNRMNEYSSFFSVTHHINVHNELDETLLYQLIQCIYNIHCDDIKLRCLAPVSGGFDKLRNCYLDRREWSSLCIETYSDYDYKILGKLGFNVSNVI